ncbi:hypothetical protein [Actinoalloteichus caeruleus]|uniref:Secreted protein n=2 Tax=Actinoalloteichus cyanogriseus TaxID=2893586 RepID=A0ABT1JEU2_ACTCY|nr:hypothetical protein [Actinoalloteichus caeruleus]MCP2330688.1 hypothetical protein [Actinoalloteichus caeruleus DSM 43889]
MVWLAVCPVIGPPVGALGAGVVPTSTIGRGVGRSGAGPEGRDSVDTPPRSGTAGGDCGGWVCEEPGVVEV